MNKKSLLSLSAAAALAPFTVAQTMENTDFSAGSEPWIAGSNLFVGGVWQAFVSSAGGDYTVDSVVTAGDTILFSSRDDETSDSIENFLFQEYGAGPQEPTLTVFSTGDVIRLAGRARVTKTGADTSDVIARAFVKTLGYNELGWAFQLKEEYTQFFDLTSDWQDFDISVTYPDLAVDDSLQVIQLGFEITTSFDGTAMDAATIEFQNLEGGVDGASGGDTWMGYEVIDGSAKTEDWMGWVNIEQAPYLYSYSLQSWLFMDESQDTTSGAWVYILK